MLTNGMAEAVTIGASVGTVGRHRHPASLAENARPITRFFPHRTKPAFLVS